MLSGEATLLILSQLKQSPWTTIQPSLSSLCERRLLALPQKSSVDFDPWVTTWFDDSGQIIFFSFWHMLYISASPNCIQWKSCCYTWKQNPPLESTITLSILNTKTMSTESCLPLYIASSTYQLISSNSMFFGDMRSLSCNSRHIL